MTVYGYLRVSTDKQDCDNQKIGVEDLARTRGLPIESWIIDDGVSGTKEPEKRKLGKLLKRIKSGDVIICSELSRLGRRRFCPFKPLTRAGFGVILPRLYFYVGLKWLLSKRARICRR